MRSKKLILSVVAIFATAFVFYAISNIGDKKQHYQARTVFDQIHTPGIKGANQWLSLMRNNPETGTVSIEDILRARNEIIQFSLLKKQKNLNLSWIEMGPDNVAGRVRALLIDKNNANRMYTGGVAGGLWISNTGGNTWNRITSISENLAVSAIAQSPSGIIYVGTGEGLAYPGGTNFNTGQLGNGMYMSTDGINFTPITSTIPNFTQFNDNIEWSVINRIACSPSSERVWVATSKGLKYSDDQGATWQNAKQNTGTNTINLTGYGTDIKIGSNGRVFYSQYQSSGGNRTGRLFVSQDGNPENFTNLTTGTPLPTDMGRIEIAIAPSNNDYVYLSCATSGGALYNVYQSTDGGQTFRVVGPGGSANLDIFGSNNQGWYDNVIAVFPNNPNKIIVGGIDLWLGEQVSPTMPFSWAQKSLWYAQDDISTDNDIFYVHADHHAYVFHPTEPNTLFIGSDGGISKSIDGANTFHTLNRGLNITQFYGVACANDHRVMGGTQDNGTQYINRKGNTPMNAKQVTGGDGGFSAFSIINPKALFTTVYYGDCRRSPDEGDNFEGIDRFFSSRMFNGTTTTFQAAFVTPILHWESLNDIYTPDSVTFVADRNYEIGEMFRARSKNNRYPLKGYITENSYQDTLFRVGDSIRIQDRVQSKFFLGVQNAVWMTREALVFGKTPKWNKIADINGVVSTMSTCQDGDHLFVGTYNGTVYRISGLKSVADSAHLESTSSQYQLEVTNIASFPGRTVTSISANWYNPDKVVVTLGNFGSHTSFIQYSNNATSSNPTFTSKQGDLPKIPVYASLIEMNRSNYVIIGTEFGMFATENITASNPSWTEINEGIGGRVPVFMLRQQTNFAQPDTGIAVDPDGNEVMSLFPGVTNSGFIYIGTHGRGIFYNSNFYQAVESIRDNTAVNKAQEIRLFPNPANNYTNLTFGLLNPERVVVRVFDLKGMLVQNIDLGLLNIGQHQQRIDISDLSVGTYIISVRGTQLNFSTKLIINK